jgi:hypothetical protein
MLQMVTVGDELLRSLHARGGNTLFCEAFTMTAFHCGRRPSEIDRLEEISMYGWRHMRERRPSINRHGLLERIKVRRAISAHCQMFLDCTTFWRIHVFVEAVTNVSIDFPALHELPPVRVIYGLSWSRKNARALRSLDFVASSEIFNIPAVSSVELPSISRRTNAAL